MRRLPEIAACCALLALSACRTVSESSLPEIVADVQWCAPAEASGDETVEILLRNKTGRKVEFVRAELDGTELPLASTAVATALRKFSFDGLGASARSRMAASAPVAGARWWQFYPSAHVESGGAAVFQMNFDGLSRPCALKLTASDGSEVFVRVPRCAPPRRRIEFLAFAGDGRSLVLRHSAGVAPDGLTVNGGLVGFRALAPSSRGLPAAVVADLPMPVREGVPVCIELTFPDGARRFAFVRAMLGVCTVAPAGWDDDFRPLPPAEREEYGFDDEMRVWRLPYDVVCDDARAKNPGACARAAVAALQARLGERPDGLCGVDFCTALHPSAWNIYSQMADAVIAKPYRLHWGVDVSRFVEEEDSFLAKVVRDVAPRPVVWVPDRFSSRRELDGREFSVLAWCAMLRGVRGVRVHHWLNDRRAPFAGNQALADAVRQFNSDFNRLRPRLERLVPMGGRTDSLSHLSILEGWCGDDGALLLVRNLRYDTGIDALTRRRVRPFSVSSTRGQAIAWRPPPWLKQGKCADALTGEPFECVVADGVLRVTIPELDAFRLAWIENAGKEARR